MPKPTGSSGEKNLVSSRLIELRRQQNLSQRDLAHKLQLAGYDMDKNVITRIETNKRYVTDIELRALSQVLGVSYAYLIDGEDKQQKAGG
ncbi:MAG: helix-turn-helix transcriptional regulator [Lachnospiraceae bacterium]|nr:helix-turn-helix transcriptional regulator [uncultured Acetatifactor sp.]MCX4341427.1 helix-turn-helix transcriptional regulator [Lachnospiraceae bacterium]